MSPHEGDFVAQPLPSSSLGFRDARCSCLLGLMVLLCVMGQLAGATFNNVQNMNMTLTRAKHRCSSQALQYRSKSHAVQGSFQFDSYHIAPSQFAWFGITAAWRKHSVGNKRRPHAK